VLQIVRLADSQVISIGDALGVDDVDYLSVDDMQARLLQLQRDGIVRIEPNPESLQAMAVRAELLRYTQREHMADGLRKFVPDRRGGRINVGTRRLGELAELHRREAIGSIQRYLTMEGPAAYRSQAQLLGLLDPDVDAELMARQSATAAGDAVRQGIAEGRGLAERVEEAS
jgi:hypothetical protein